MKVPFAFCRQLLFCAMLMVPTWAQAQQPLRLASTPWSPFTNAPGKPRFAIDLVLEALKRSGIAADSAIVDEGKLTPSLLKGEFDGSAALWKDDERVKALVYSQAYLENRLVLVGQKGSDVSATKLAELSGKRVALVEGYAYGDAIKSPTGPIYVPSTSEEDSLQKVLNGEAAYTLMDEIVVEYILKNYAEQARTRLAFGSVPLIVRSLHFAIRRDLPNAVSLVDRFNAQIIGMIADHTYHRLLQVDWIQADVDGDGLTEYVPRDDRAGPLPPERGYSILSIDQPKGPATPPKRYYFGGNVYQSWSNVPDKYTAPLPPGGASRGAEFPIFTFKF